MVYHAIFAHSFVDVGVGVSSDYPRFCISGPALAEAGIVSYTNQPGYAVIAVILKVVDIPLYLEEIEKTC